MNNPPSGRSPVADAQEPRCGDELNRGPSIADEPRKFEAVHRTRHLDVGETISISGRTSRMAIASSALPASTTSKPASATISAALIRSSSSSSTIRTTGRQSAKAIQIPSFAIAQVRGGASFRQPRPAAQDGSDPEIPAISSASCYGSGRPAPQPRLTEQIHALAI
jgi:hypothetical protein